MGQGRAPNSAFQAGGSDAAARIICALLAGLVLSSPVHALSISLNPLNKSGQGLSSLPGDAVFSPGVTGVPGYSVAGTYWNNLLQNDVGTAWQLRDSGNPGGYDSGVWAMWRSAAVSSFSPTLPWDASPNYKMMWGAMSSTDESNDTPPPADFFTRSANQPLIYVRGLSTWLNKPAQPAGANSYAVILYVDGDGTDRTNEYWLQKVPASSTDPPTTLGLDLTTHVFVHENGTHFAGTFTRISPSADSENNAASGNYILWQGLTADRFVVRTEARTSHDGQRRAVINGLQIVAEPNTTPAITIAGGAAAEPSANGTFTITRSGSKTSPLTVYYAVGGTATAGSDYYAEDLPGSVTIPANSASATLTVRPKADNLIEGPETIIIAPVARGDYRDATPGAAGATMSLADTQPPTRLDADRDGDIDQADFAVFQRCFTGDGQLVTLVACLEMDVNGDQRVNGADFEVFARCMSGPRVAVSTDCLGH